jgi:hypothetical protein
MTVEDTRSIDIVATRPDGGVVLVIVDDLGWDDPNHHMFLIQEKINAYCDFVESGEFRSKFAQAKVDPITILLKLAYPPPNEVQWFLSKTTELLLSAGYYFEVERFSVPDN